MSNEDIIKSIKKDFRLGMNGIVSTSMREKGMNYKINFGLSLPQIRNIAQKYPQNSEVAEMLWKENIRESKLLATMLYPLKEMTLDKAEKWINDIEYNEISDIASMYLFAKVPFAIELVLNNIKTDNDNKIYFGLRLLTRLLINKTEISNLSLSEIANITRNCTSSNNITVALVANDVIQKLGIE